jgi:sporulation protein YqfC
MKERHLSSMEQISDTLHLPGDILANAPVLTAVGHRTLYLENYRSIIEYTERELKLLTKTGRIHIEGEDLHIKYYTGDVMKITGSIHRITYKQPNA